jgi:hypothetical protein
LGVIRDPAKNDVIRFPLEKNKAHFTDGFDSQIRRTQVQHSPFIPELRRVFASYAKDRNAAEEPVLV